MFLKEKWCGRIKGLGCIDGRKQRLWKSKEDTTSPTVSIEALLLSCMIDAKEERDVATIDIPVAFMQALIDELVHVKFDGELIDLICQVDPSLTKFVAMEKRKEGTIHQTEQGPIRNSTSIGSMLGTSLSFPN